MEQVCYQLITCFDYVIRYLTLKIARTIIPSVIIMALILLVRKCMDGRMGNRTSSIKLYIRCYLWMTLLPVPFMGGLKLSYEHFHWRNRIYIFYYDIIMGHSVFSRLYFAGMIILLIWFILRKIRLRRWIQKLEIYTGHDLEKRIEIRINPFAVSPFTTGIFKHRIVLPEYIIKEFAPNEIEGILQHEYNHIKRGHLAVYVLIDLFRILWFFNPLAHFCAKKIREDMELMCDYSTIRNNLYLPDKYGMVLIKSMKWIKEEVGNPKTEKSAPAFVAESSFSVMKKRIQMIAGYTEFPHNHGRIICIAAGLFAVAIIIFVKQMSYPAYTPYGDFSLYSFDSTEVIFQENEEFDSAITMKESGLMVDNRKVTQMLLEKEKYSAQDSFWIYYGGFMKMPGIGGGGDVLEYSPGSESKEMVFIPCNNKSRVSEMIEWILKYM